jgi:hypothetical protein
MVTYRRRTSSNGRFERSSRACRTGKFRIVTGPREVSERIASL